jgi:hypothetical protein
MAIKDGNQRWQSKTAIKDGNQRGHIKDGNQRWQSYGNQRRQSKMAIKGAITDSNQMAIRYQSETVIVIKEQTFNDVMR